uniref:DNA primase DnaG n=1 Tax=Fervidicoccus fontis TaxID=683846 RepID=A0A7J3ZK07_9CREN
MKYLIRARIEVEGIVDRHDVIGALFGQTEGLLPELDLRELQEKGRVGRVHVDIKPENGKMRGEIRIPSNLDKTETALVAALIETVDKVGPYPAKIQVFKITDLRLEKLRRAVERAKEILREWQEVGLPDIKELVREIEESIKPGELIEYGKDRLPAGSGIDKSDTIIIVEGRADVINLLRYGYDNVIAIEGARGEIPETIKELAERKKTILFVDGDHAGELIARDLARTLKIDYIARAPPGKEVEELTGREIARALERKVPTSQLLQMLEVRAEKRQEALEAKAVEREETVSIDIPPHVIEETKNLKGTLEAIVYDRDWKPIKRIPVRDLYQELRNMNPGSVGAVVFDGIITQRIVDVASEKKVGLVIGARIGNIAKREEGVNLLTIADIAE